MTAFRVSSSAAGLSCTGLKCHAYYEFNTAKRSFIHVCLLIALFSILVFGCLESDDRSCRRLRHCSLVTVLLNKIEALQTMKCCTAKRCYIYICCCKFQFRHVLSQRLMPTGFFLRNKPGQTVSDDTILTCIYTIFSCKFEIDNPDFSPV